MVKGKVKKFLSMLLTSAMLVSTYSNVTVSAAGVSEDTVLYYEMAEKGGKVTDSKNNYDGTLVGTTNWVRGLGNQAVWLAGGEDYIKIPKAALTQSDKVTISAWIKPDVVKNWTALFVAGSGTDNYAILAAQGTPRGKAVGLTMGIKENGGEEDRLSAAEGVTLDVNEWSLVTYAQEGTRATLYLNGEQVAQTNEMEGSIKGVLEASDDADVRIGDNRMFPDPSLKGAVTEVLVSKKIVSAEELKAEVASKTGTDESKVQQGAEYVQRYVDYIVNDGYELLTGDKMDEYLGKELDCTITWTLTEGKAVIKDGKLTKTADSAERQPVKLKAVVSKGESHREVVFHHVTLMDEYVGYILSFFGGDDGEQKLHLGYSYDGINWKKLNDGKTVLKTTKGNGNVRDPYIMRKKDGSFAVIATQGWDTNSIYLWDSEDLVEYSNERLKQVTYEGEVGLTGRRAWAPEASYDPITDQYVIYWSDPNASDGKGKTYANTSADLNDFSKPYVLFDAGYKIIDANIIKWRGTYYMVYKDERGNNSNGGGGKHILMAKSDSLNPGTFTQYTDAITEAPVEGPFMFKALNEDKWYHYYDYFNEHKFGVSVTTDLDSGKWEFLGKSTTMPTDTVQHGGAIAVTQKELNRIAEAFDLSGDFLSMEAEAVEKGAKYVQEYVDYIVNDGYELLTGEKMDEYMGTQLNCKIDWTLTEGKAVIQDGKLTKTTDSAERQPVKLKAVVSRGNESREIQFEHITLLDEYIGYILSFFGGDDAKDQVHLGYSYDGLKWNRLNDSKTIIKTTLGNHAVRDPYIMRKKDGSFAVIATQGWDTQYIYLWDSEDLVTYQNERLVKVAEQNDAIKLTGKRAWAPEATYDPIKDQYIVYWSDPKYADDTYKCGGTYANTSKNLVNFSAPFLFFDVGYKNIDANILKWRGDYYMDFKGNNQGDCVGIQLAKADYIEPGTFETYTGAFVSKTEKGDIEGPFMFQAIGEDRWYVYYDYYGSHKFGVSTTTNLNTDQWDYLGISTTMPSERVQHGGVIAVTQKEMDRILKAYDTTEHYLSVEAEYGEVKGAAVIENAEFSNGRYVGNLGGATNGTSTFTVKATEAGKHMIKVHYATAQQRMLGIQVNDKEYSLNCPATEGWSKLSTEPQTIEVELKAGENVIQLGGVNGADAPNVDRIEIQMEASELLQAVQFMIDSLPAMQEITADDKIKFDAVQTTYDVFENKLAVKNLEVLEGSSNQIAKCQEAKVQLAEAVKEADEIYTKGQGEYLAEKWNTFVLAYQAAAGAEENLTVEEFNHLQNTLKEAQKNLISQGEEETSSGEGSVPSEPTMTENPTTPDTPTIPKNPTTPDIPTIPEEPTTPDTPTAPEEPTTPASPTIPDIPTTPDTPTTPDIPTIPTGSTAPASPTIPATPIIPDLPTLPVTPTNPELPTNQDVPIIPVNPTSTAAPTHMGFVKVENIKITGISRRIAAGKRIQLSAEVMPAEASCPTVIWTTSDEKYAKVSADGLVTLYKAGKNKTVTITATATDGSGVKKKYKIKIMPNAVKNITIEAASKTVKTGSRLQLKAIVTPDTALKKINKQLKWSSSNKKFATVTSKGLVKAKKAGKNKKVKITAKATDGSNKKQSIIITIK